MMMHRQQFLICWSALVTLLVMPLAVRAADFKDSHANLDVSPQVREGFLTPGLASGESRHLPKKSSEQRPSGKLSERPSLPPMLQPQYLADLAGLLIAQNEQAPGEPAGKNDSKPQATSPAKDSPEGAPADASPMSGLTFQTEPERVVIRQRTQPVAEFVFHDPKILRPYFANICLPNGVKVTRNFPAVADGDLNDHADMHPGIWMGFGDLNGDDFWRNRGRIQHIKFIEPPQMSEQGVRFTTESTLFRRDNQPIGRMANRFLVSPRLSGLRIVWQAEFFADRENLILGDQEEMGFGVRAATSLLEKNHGLMRNSEGKETAKAIWGQGADWCDSSGKIDGRPCGITTMASPANFRRSWWHTRENGLMVANPFGQHAMQQGGPSQVVVKQGDSLRLTFAVIVHGEENYDPAHEFKQFSKTAQQLIQGNR